MRTRSVAVAAGLAATAMTATMLAAPAAQAESRSLTVGMHCYGTNPNLLGLPFYGGANITTNAPWPGQITINSDSKDFLPYTTRTTVRVTSLSTNRTRTYHRTWTHSFSDASGYSISSIPARGRIKVTISSVNVGLFQTLRGPTCTGVVRV